MSSPVQSLCIGISFVESFRSGPNERLGTSRNRLPDPFPNRQIDHTLKTSLLLAIRIHSNLAKALRHPTKTSIRVSAQKIAAQDDHTVCGKVEKDHAEDSIGETEKDRANAVGNDVNNADQRGEPCH